MTKLAPIDAVIAEARTGVVQTQFESVRAGLCPDCGAALPARAAHRAIVECSFCAAAWSTEHHPEPPREAHSA